MQKDTQPSQTCSGGHIITNPTQIDAGDASLLMGSINWTRLSKEVSPASIWGRVCYDVSSWIFLAGLGALLHEAKSILLYFRVLRGV